MPLSLNKVLVTAGLALLSAPASAQPTLDFAAVPASGELRPGEPETTLSIAATDAGKPASGWLHLTLLSPAKNKVFSTDFPIVEGTELLTTTLPMTGGKWQTEYRLPIRGTYTVYAAWGPTPEAAEAAVPSTWTFTAHEQPAKVRHLAVLLSLLLILGTVSGLILGRSRRQLSRLGAA